MIRKHLLAGFMFASVAGSAGLQAINFDFSSFFNDTTITIGGIAVTGSTALGAESLHDTELGKKVEELTGQDLRNMSDASLILALQEAAKLLTKDSNQSKDQTNHNLQRGALFGAAVGLVTNKTVNSIAKKIPYVGERLTCTSKKCQGICKKCYARKLAEAIVISNAANIGVNAAKQKWDERQSNSSK